MLLTEKKVKEKSEEQLEVAETKKTQTFSRKNEQENTIERDSEPVEPLSTVTAG